MSDFDDQPDVASVLAPITVTDDMIVSVTSAGNPLPEDPSPAWAAGTTYGVGDRAHLVSTHRVYESVKAGNVGKDPSVQVNQYNADGTASWWIDIGPTNRYAAFDTLISTPIAAPGPLEIKLQPGAFNGLALFGIDADFLEIHVIDGSTGEIVYLYSEPLEDSMPDDYYEYFFEPFRPQTQFIATSIEPYSSAQLTVTLYKASGLAKVGMVAMGDLRPLGAPLRGASVEPVDYSYVSTDQFGNTTIRRRSSATSLVLRTKMGIESANTVLNVVQSLLGTPVVLVGSKAMGYEAMTVFGLLSARMEYDDFEMPTLNISLKGLI